MKLLIRWASTAIALLLAVRLVPGIEVEGNAWVVLGVTAIIFGVVNMLVRPLLKLLSCGLIALTLGLFLLVINGLMLWLSSYIAVNWFDVGFYVNGFVPALLGSIVVSVVSFVANLIFHDDGRRRDEDR
jgi:putative membrane protein